jgi:hypothetical protein
VTGQPVLLTLAGLALSVAGFAGLVGAFRAGEAWTRTDVWRLHNIVRLSFVTMFLALVPVTVFALTGDEPLAIRLASAAIAGATLFEIRRVLGEREQWSDTAWIRPYVTITGAYGLLQLVNVALAHVGVLILGLVLSLEHPAHLFVNVVSSFRPASTRE